MSQPHDRAIAHVTTLATGSPADPAWRVTLHFHPDRLVGGVPILEPMARDGVYRSQFETGTSNGGSPRFGSAYLRLTQDTLACTTFRYPDSVFEPAHFRVAVRLSTLVDMASADKDRFDDYIEAHVHGVVDLVRDVEALVLDPCYRGTPVAAAVGALLPGRMARRLRADHDVTT